MSWVEEGQGEKCICSVNVSHAVMCVGMHACVCVCVSVVRIHNCASVCVVSMCVCCEHVYVMSQMCL